MNHSTRSCIVASAFALSALLPPAAAAQLSSAEYFSKLLNDTPQSERLTSNGVTVGNARWWRVTNKKSSYAGLTLLFIDLDLKLVGVTIDDRAGNDLTSTAIASPLLIASGMAASPKMGGLVPERGGGVLVRCNENVAVLPAEMAAAAQRSCRSGLQILPSKKLLIYNGNPANSGYDLGANRLAVGTGSGRLFIAGAFDDLGLALPLRDFTQFIVLAAARANLARPSAIDLAGACSAQVDFNGSPPHRFGGCGRAQSFVNRIVVSKRGAS